MIFGETSKTSIGVLKLGPITIRSRVYKYTDLYKLVLQDKKYITKTSPFTITKGKKDFHIFEYNKWWLAGYKTPTFLNIGYLNKLSDDNKNKTSFLIYTKWRLANLGLIMKEFMIEEISVGELVKFIMYNLNSIDLAKQLACLLSYKETYTIDDIRNLYSNCCKKCNNSTNINKNIDKQMFGFIKMFYSIEEVDTNKLKDIEKFNLTKNKAIKMLAELYETTEYIISTYTKSVSKLTNYILEKNLSVEEVKERLKEYRQQENSNIHLDIDGLVSGRKVKATVGLHSDNYLNQFNNLD